ncbi:MAG TPA: ribosome small subunit-dependent GTPase A [Acidimicrobiales bacterium]
MTSFPALLPYGWGDRWAALLGEVPDGRPGRVIRHDGVAVLVMTADGERSIPLHRTLEPAPVVGDWLGLASDDRIAAVLPRSSLLRRRAAGREVEQPIVANADLVVIVCGLDRPVERGRIQRFTALAWDAGAEPAVVLTKADLADDPAPVVATVTDEAPGIEVRLVSSVRGDGIDEVRRLVAGRSVVLVGESGAGKSTLLNALADADIAATGAVRASDAKGRHTTTSRHLHPLPGGGVLIDTPGVREVGLWVEAGAVADTFPEIDELAVDCRFNDCIHETEPGCAVTAAVAAGDLAADRLQAWRDLLAEAQSATRRSDPAAQRRFGRQSGRIAREAQRLKNAADPTDDSPPT